MKFLKRMFGMKSSDEPLENPKYGIPKTIPVGEESISNKVVLGAGCYWGTEKYIRKNFQAQFPNSIKRIKVGFMSPYPEKATKSPVYEDVCRGGTWQVEVAYIELNDPEAHYEPLLRFFFQFHDPTTKNRQGNDSGFQYASWIFTYDKEQDRIARQVRQELQSLIDEKKLTRFQQNQVVTRLAPASKFWSARLSHQNYLANNPLGYCNHFIRFKKWPSQVPEDGVDKLTK